MSSFGSLTALQMKREPSEHQQSEIEIRESSRSSSELSCLSEEDSDEDSQISHSILDTSQLSSCSKTDVQEFMMNETNKQVTSENSKIEDVSLQKVKTE